MPNLLNYLDVSRKVGENSKSCLDHNALSRRKNSIAGKNFTLSLVEARTTCYKRAVLMNFDKKCGTGL
ncbi:MAG: hypothetical protein D3922_13190 [Candidatus Electrothrix sp. AR1]|nr:hypothetical protein [Candidatus Electrothrix sp. AR1]